MRWKYEKKLTGRYSTRSITRHRLKDLTGLTPVYLFPTPSPSRLINARSPTALFS